MKRCNKQSLMLHYTIPNFSNVHEFLSLLARRFGKLKKGGVTDIEGAAKMVLQDWNRWDYFGLYTIRNFSVQSLNYLQSA